MQKIDFWSKTIGSTVLFFSKIGRFDTFWKLKNLKPGTCEFSKQMCSRMLELAPEAWKLELANLCTHLQHSKLDVKNYQNLSKSEISKIVKKKWKNVFFSRIRPLRLILSKNSKKCRYKGGCSKKVCFLIEE